MRALVINDNTKNIVNTLLKYAKDNPWDINRMQLLANGEILPPGDCPEYTCNIPYGFRVVFTIEQHPKKDKKHAVWARHLSVSVDGDKWPNPAAVQEIINLFEFENQLENCMVWEEAAYRAINIMELTGDEEEIGPMV